MRTQNFHSAWIAADGTAGVAGSAIGRSGGGPHSVCAVCHFPSLALPITVARFAEGEAEGVAETEALTIALRCSGKVTGRC